MTDDEWIAWIDSASLEDLLRKWRYEPLGSILFCGGRVSDHYEKTMAIRRKESGPGAWTEASKKVGWGSM